MSVTLPIAQQQQAIASASQAWNVPEWILWGVYGRETSFGKNVKNSTAGAVGPFQFIPTTARTYNYPLTNTPSYAQFWAQAQAAAHKLSNDAGISRNWSKAVTDYGGGYTLQQVHDTATGPELKSIMGSGWFPGLALGIVGGGLASVAGAAAGADAAAVGAGETAAGGSAASSGAGAALSGAKSLAQDAGVAGAISGVFSSIVGDAKYAAVMVFALAIGAFLMFHGLSSSGGQRTPAVVPV